MKKKRNAKTLSIKDQKIRDLEQGLINNGIAMTEHRRRKTWSLQDFISIKPLNTPQQSMFESYFGGNNIIANGSAGTGKAQPLDAKVLTPNGWVEMGSLSVGDTVLTPKNKQSKILQIYPQGEKEIYTIKFKDGTSTEACLEHLWECNIPNDKWGSKPSTKKIVNTATLIELLDKYKDSKANISIDVVDSIDFKEKDLPLDPYMLGTLLGDGGITNNVVLSSTDQSILDNVAEKLPEEYHLYKLASGDCDYSISQKTYRKKGYKSGVTPNLYKVKLSQLGLMGCTSDMKFIPECYKTSSKAQRFELLQGLFDTDGTVDHRTGSVSYCTVSELLSNDVAEIVRSLGGKASIKTCTKHYTYKGERKKGKSVFIVTINHELKKDFFTLERKRELINDTYDVNQNRKQFESIEFNRIDKAQCILIDDEHHLYITDDYIITHNTFAALYLAGMDVVDKKQPQQRIIIVRSAVSTRELGHLPGDVNEKLEPYERPYKDIMKSLTGNPNTYDDMKEAGIIEFMPTSYIRGLNWDDAVVIIDEVQNLNFHELNSVITRVGDNTKLIIVGDQIQTDLYKSNNDKSGMERFLQIASKMPEFDEIVFGKHDIIRSKFVKSWICALEEAG